jgi:hypothetical protein
LHNPDPINIRDHDVLLALPVPGGPATQLVGALVNLRDEAGVVVLVVADGDPVAHGHGIGHVLPREPKFPANA